MAAATIALRAVGPVLTELPLAPNPGAQVWVAIIRPGPHPGSWSRTLWQPSPDAAGWLIPNTCTYATIIEVGADDASPRRWYGIALAHDHDWLITHGPYPHPALAHQQANDWLTTARTHAVQLHSPTVERTEAGRRPRLEPDEPNDPATNR